MSSPLRNFAYQHRWFYDMVTAISALSVGGVNRLRKLGFNALQGKLSKGAKVLDLCCGSGEAAAPWIKAGFAVTGLDVSPQALALAAEHHPQLQQVEGMAEDPPLKANQFAAIQLSLALHEFNPEGRVQVLKTCLRLLQPGGWLVLVDLHPAGPCLKLPQKMFCALFETETALLMLKTDLPNQLQELGFTHVEQKLLAGQAMQLITARLP
ncbi:MAG: class I SAM-dependent methyltransferase [Prochlorococcus sp.]|nr:class I SAM-dependent methyltransferase [Prochlorococcaceae cyanobacterium ETNP18_MAG_14]MDP6321141.1 class I SAM-dependent methyltransferase [Prochlorococcaceae cyanobacterium ETNP14_MAG_5]|tara:strand:+ start:4233 stop:4862 length:630 start_codon:yes stop_codon:yes gene_type:complete